MINQRRWKLLAPLLALSLVAAACSRSDDDSSTEESVAATESPTDDSVDSGTQPPVTEPATDTAAEPDTSEPVGTDPGDPEPDVPEAWTIDTSQCPSGWDTTTGISDTEIKFGLSAPQSGPLADLNFLGAGIDAYFNYANAELGGIDGKNLVLVRQDDAYDPTRTVTNVSDLIESEQVFGLVNVLGTPNNLAIWDDVNAQCVPHVFTGTGANEWGDVDGHPWSSGSFMSYPTEAAMWARYLQTEYPDGVTVATMSFDNGFGESYEEGFAAAIEGTNIEVEI